MVRMDSFRLRIALLSAAVAGVVVVAFGVSAWCLIYRANLGRVDEQIRARLLGFLAIRHHSRHWTNPESGTDVVGEEYRNGPWILLVKDAQGHIAYRSPTWPETLSPDLLQIAMPDDEEWEVHPPGERQRDAAEPSDVPPSHIPRGGRPPPFPEHQPYRPGHPGEFSPSAPPPPPMPYSALQFNTCNADAQSWRLAAVANPNLTLLLGVNLGTSVAEMRSIQNAFLLALPVALLLVASGAMLIAKRALEPIARLTQAVESIDASELAQRIPTDRTDGEFQGLIMVFNAMMDRLENSFQQAARFSADAAHELNTPLTVLQGHLDCAIQSAASGSDEQQALSRLLEQVERLKGIVRNLLLIAQADAGQLAKKLEWTDLTEALENLREDIETMAPHLTVTTNLAPGIGIMADRNLLVRMLHNLASNAVKYNSGDGWIAIDLTATDTVAKLTLSNSGPEISEEDREQLFDRFFRVDASRSNRWNSAGLGLSLAREIARAHGGDLGLKKAQGGVVAFELSLPVSPARQPSGTA